MSRARAASRTSHRARCYSARVPLACPIVFFGEAQREIPWGHHWPVWMISLGFAVWALCWTIVSRYVRHRLPEKARPAELFAWAVVLGTAFASMYHWSLLLAWA
jgi:hypothetical protein